MKIADFCAKHPIQMTTTFLGIRASENRGPHNMHQWFVVLTFQGREMTQMYWTGLGHVVRRNALKTEPKIPNIVDVLACLQSDASMSDTFEDFCAGMGYDEDSRNAYRTWEACQDIGRKLRKLLGYTTYRELMECEPE